MSFFVEAREVDLDVARARELSNSSTQDGGYPLSFSASLFRRRVKKLLVADWRLGEGLLADDADWDASTWSMQPTELPRLEATIQAVCRELPEGFDFVASWISEPLDRNVDLSCEELLQLVRESALNGHTAYRVRPSAVARPRIHAEL